MCNTPFLLKNGIDRNFFYQHHLLYNRNKMKVKECLWCGDKNAIKSHFIQEKKIKDYF
mgnify:CR=1 FL=1